MLLKLLMFPSVFISCTISYLYIPLAFLLIGKNAAVQEMPCDKSRQIFNSYWGIITDGPPNSNYTQDSHCEWLIKAPTKNYYITLSFHTMGTECSYDYIFVYDGDTFDSPLLASFSGNTIPQQITSQSGSMLILLYSDANYVLGGFHAEFSVTQCPRNCTGHGSCIDNKCVCKHGWGGADCSFEFCPENCGFEFGRGSCDGKKCSCSLGYSGQACDLKDNDPTGNRWHWLSQSENGFSKRAGHSAVYLDETDSFYVFGGFDLNNILGDLSIYNFKKNTWEDQYGNSFDASSHLVQKNSPVIMKSLLLNKKKRNIKSESFIKNFINFEPSISNWLNDSLNHKAKRELMEAGFEDVEKTSENAPYRKIQDNSSKNLNHFDKIMSNTSFEGTEKEKLYMDHPSPRYGHAACRYPGGLVIYGGKTSDGSLSDELWFYNVTTKKWSLRAKLSKIRPPKLTRHSLTLVGENFLYLFGGSTADGEFSSKMYSIQLGSEKSEQWKHILPRGGKEFDVRLVAHTTVYSAKIHSLIIYGGILAGIARLFKLSDKMFLFKISNRHWSEINYPRAHLYDSYVPRERAFHTSAILGNYLVVFGGYSHRHNKEEICYDNQMYLYHLGCHTWISHDVLGTSKKTSTYWKRQGVFAHAADVRRGNTLLIVGGYHGNVNGDFWAFVLPPTLASSMGESFEPEQICGRHRSLHECTSNPECGWCPADEVCYGRTIGINCTTNLQTTICPGLCPALGDCHSCLIHGEPPTANEPPSSVAHKLKLEQCIWCVQNARCHHKDDNYGVCGLQDDIPLQSQGWWGFQGTEITSVEECKTKDHRPGLTFIKYKHPINLSHPDFVTIINGTTIDFDISVRDARAENSAIGGTITARLLGYLRIPDEWANKTETLKMCTSFSHTVLRLSNNSLGFNSEIVGNVTADTTTCKTVFWPSGSPVTLHPGRYFIDFESKKSLSPRLNSYQTSKMVLMHNKSQESGKIFTFQYLEPYKNGSCQSYSNCLQCLSDSLCGWCDLSQTCFSRNINESQFCSVDGEWRYLIIQPSACANCSNYISCDICVSNSLCEWWVDEGRCSRRGRSTFALRNSFECPISCHLRQSCSECLNERGRCVWCEATKECFSFSVYTSEYQFGLCREWIDQNYSAVLQSVTLKKENNFIDRNNQCKNCSRHVNCSECLRTLSCGWCYETNNPIVGVCVAGNFNKPEAEYCNNVIEKIHKKSLDANDVGWSYAQCPDVDECELKLDDCHADAICTNTDGSYTCECRRGFFGDGRHSCTKTCYNECINGVCTMAPDYRCQCDLGWTGEDCGTDCGCNNHSTCHTKIGLCDKCQDWTTGEHCELCKVGSYGNATTKEKCKKCECNGHEDSSRGFCDSKTGVCFCKDNTEGDKCEKCQKGYYGNPVNGGFCYYQCVARGMISALGPQGIGSYRSSMTPWEARLEGSSARECLWILNSSQLTNTTHPSVIQLTINGDINVTCQENSVFLYEGLPDLVSVTHQNHALGTFCQRDDKSALTVETKSGILTVLYKQGNQFEGFNATYNIFTCPSNCPSNRICVQNECVCKEGWTGFNCSFPVCYNNCSFHLRQGVCNKEYGRCVCKQGFGSSDCSVKITDYQIIFTELFNSAKLSSGFEHLRKMIPRFGHSLVIDRRGSLWMFGGYSLSHGPLNDIRLFDTKNNTWMQVTVDSTRDASMPQGRYFHASEIIHSRREIYVFGGIGTKEGSSLSRGNNTLKDFWKFSIKHQRWVDIETENSPPAVAGHSLTLMKDLDSENLFLIGGISEQEGFMNQIWCFNLETERWNTVKSFGSGPFGIYGHTSVYHAPTKSFYVYGGYQFSSNRTFYSNKLYSFYYPSMTWSLLPTFEEYNPVASNLPQSRFLHSAISTKEYMLVFGGKMFQKSTISSQVSDSLIAYSYSCNQWIRLLYRGAPVVGSFPPLTYAQAMAYDSDTGAAYVVGGFDNIIHSEVTRINLPRDLCNLWRGKEKCRSFLGCSFCSVMRPDKTLSSHCYSSSKSLKESCDYYNGTLIMNNGVVCDNKWFRHRSCEHFKTCDECLAKWPSYMSEENVCKWCSNCSRKRCVPFNHACQQDGKCDIIDAEKCGSEQSCLASECEKCEEMKSCRWTNGSCVKKDSATADHETFVCPPRCSDLKDCSTCLSHECRWSTALKECISPDFQPLLCAGGTCGLVLKKESIDKCPEPCFSYDQCAVCLKNSHCGWCSVNDDTYSGQGICTEGTLDRPSGDSCEALLSQSDKFNISNGSIAWNYVTCPEENECTNGHHTCNSVSEKCEDLRQGFECVCGEGYKLSRLQCEPICSQGCVRGKCVQPNQCLCDFGYVGANCSIQCQCNGHSNCAGPDKLDECLECHNNTKGAQCERCKPFFVGDPTNNGKCIPCFEYCNEHTDICVNDSPFNEIFVNKNVTELISLENEGPKANAMCVACANETKGKRCEECIEGFFRGTGDLRQHCRPCECHGHGDRCDPVTGEKCNCANNTESECQMSASKNSNQQCWMLQCSKCKETYSGTPTNGHQCYKQMTLDHKFCFNSKLIEECKIKPKPLYPGQSSFFQVQPRYVNVDIRVFIDVLEGSLDLYLSIKDDSLVVLTNSSSGKPFLKWDSKYKTMSDTVKPSGFKVPSSDTKLSSEKDFFLHGNLSGYDSLSNKYFEMEQKAEGLTTYITLDRKNTFLHVKNIRSRLIVALPKDKFDLISTRFYLGLMASTEGEGVGPTYGVLYFRQDQLHIDLFVFFSVFFSCFFLFLAGCVIAWKAKQAADVRRARRRHFVEMLHLAKRPFASVAIYLENEDTEESPVLFSQSPHKRKRIKPSVCLCEPRPFAIEPTNDGMAAIVTFFVKLPGGSEAPVQLSLASSLVMTSKNSRGLRRRNSHLGSF